MSTKTVYKKNGTMVPYNRNKIKVPLSWAVNQANLPEVIVDRYLNLLEDRIHNGMPTKIVFSELIKVVAGDITRMNTAATYVASSLYALQMYIESMHNFKPFLTKDSYPNLQHMLDIGIRHNVYNPDIVNAYSKEEIAELNEYIRPEEDFTFTLDAITTFASKYCKTVDRKYLELPQLTYMRTAMGIFYNMTGKKATQLATLGYTRMSAIKALYDVLVKGQATFGSTIMNSPMTFKKSMSNCVLNTLSNSTFDIHNKYSTIGQYTKEEGGLAIDVSHIQAKGTLTKKQVMASGIIPYIITMEKVIISMAQSESKKGSAVITCAWWHPEIKSFITLKDSASGTESNRAPHLMYSVATNNFLYKAAEEDKEVSLFNPPDAPLLNTTFGDEWLENYKMYEKSLIPRTTINAKELMEHIIKYEYQTGNVYEINLDNTNKQGMLNRYVGSSNLCVTGKTYVLTDKGNKCIEDLAGGTHMCWNGKEFTETPIYKVSDSEKVFRVTLSDGSNLRVTDGHRWLTSKGIIETNQLEKGDRLPIYTPSDKIRCGDVHHIEFPAKYRLTSVSTKAKSFIPGFEIITKSFFFWFKKVHNYKVLSDNKTYVINCRSAMYARHLRLALQERGFRTEVSGNTLYLDSKLAKVLDIFVDEANLPPITIESVVAFNNEEPVYCGTEPDKGRLMFNGVLTNNCSEITEPSRGVTQHEEYVDDNGHVVSRIEGEEIALCNLASFNALIDEIEDEEEYRGVIRIMMIALDNTIEISEYVRAAARISNERYRYIGLGTSNYAYYFARKRLKMDSPEGLIQMVKFEDRISAAIWEINADLAQAFGVAPGFEETKWADGLLPYDEANNLIKEKFGMYVDHERLDRVRAKTKLGVRNVCMRANAPTASSATAKGLLNSIEPAHALEYRVDGAIVIRVLVPEVNTLCEYYTLAFKADQHMLMVGNAIRQMFIDQSQSFRRYISLENANYEYLFSLKSLANQLGVKTQYYTTSEKEDIHKESEDALNAQDGIDALPIQGDAECLSCGA